MVEFVAAADDPVEPQRLVRWATEELGVTNAEARRTIRDLTHGLRDERKLVHILDGRLELGPGSREVTS